MKKPNSYDETNVRGGFEAVELGGHYCEIKQVEETVNKDGKDMVVITFDFAKNDKQAGYFMNSFANDIRPEKKWPFAGSKYIMVFDYKDPNKTNEDFKTFCWAVENSNKGFTISWGDNWGEQFAGKKIGCVYGREESEYNGKVSMRINPRFFTPVDRVETAKVPADKMLKNRPAIPDTSDLSEINTDELPF